MCLTVHSLDLHQDCYAPDHLWFISFIYDDKGHESDEGDIVVEGTKEDMTELYNKLGGPNWKPTEYKEACIILDKMAACKRIKL